MQEGAHQNDAAPMYLEIFRSLHTEEKGKLIKWEGGGVGVGAPGFEGLKIISARKDGGREGVPVPWSHRDKRISERSGPALF